MSSPILPTVSRIMLPLLLLFSLFLLLRGHNEPGGGFAGGLVAATAFTLYAIAYDVTSSRQLLRLDTHLIIGAGLLIAVGAGIWPLLSGEPFLTGQWGYVPIPGIGSVDFGTPFLFDVGVYLVVVGVTLMIILPLAEE